MTDYSTKEIFSILGRKVFPTRRDDVSTMTGDNIRLSGTTTEVLESYDQNPQDGPLGPVNGRTGNEWVYPDSMYFVLEQEDSGDRNQTRTGDVIHEGPIPGRIPRSFTNKISGKLGRGITGNPTGDTGFINVLSGNPDGGLGDQMYVPHTPVPRNSIVARPYKRTVDDAVNVPAIYVSDGNRR